MASEAPPITTESFQLEKGQELRLDCVDVQFVLEKGEGEIFGFPLVEGKQYSLQAQRVPIFTWSGCAVKVTGSFRHSIGKETPMPVYREVYNKIRELDAPRVLIAGPCDSGKSSLCKIFSSYTVRDEKSVVFVDLDPGQNVSIPGSVLAMLLTTPWSFEEGLDSVAPFSFFYGHSSPDRNRDLFYQYIHGLGISIQHRMEADPHSQKGGVIVNSCGWITGAGYQILKQSIETLMINYVVVLEDQELDENLRKDFAEKNIQISYLPKSDGVLPRQRETRFVSRLTKIRQYFYGAHSQLSPVVQTFDMRSLMVVRIGADRHPLAIVPTRPKPDMRGAILGVSHAPSLETIPNWNIAGYVYVENVNEKTNEITLLCPSKGPLPGNFLIVGSIRMTNSN